MPRQKSTLIVVLLLVCITGGSGCASHHSSVEVPALWQASGFHPPMPDRPFPSYQAMFKYIAACEGLPQDDQTILGLAADSAVERSHVEAVGALLVIRAEYYGHNGQDCFGIRGAQGNGRFYAFQMLDGGWRLVGIFHANRLRWDCVGDQVRVLADWHSSGADDAPTIYTWRNGRFE